METAMMPEDHGKKTPNKAALNPEYDPHRHDLGDSSPFRPASSMYPQPVKHDSPLTKGCRMVKSNDDPIMVQGRIPTSAKDKTFSEPIKGALNVLLVKPFDPQMSCAFKPIDEDRAAKIVRPYLGAENPELPHPGVMGASSGSKGTAKLGIEKTNYYPSQAKRLEDLEKKMKEPQQPKTTDELLKEIEEMTPKVSPQKDNPMTSFMPLLEKLLKNYLEMQDEGSGDVEDQNKKLWDANIMLTEEVARLREENARLREVK